MNKIIKIIWLNILFLHIIFVKNCFCLPKHIYKNETFLNSSISFILENDEVSAGTLKLFQSTKNAEYAATTEIDDSFISQQPEISTDDFIESSSESSSENEITTAIDSIYKICKNVKTESPLQNLKMWQYYLQDLDYQSSHLMGNELKFNSEIAWNLTYAVLSTLDNLLPLDNIWSLLDTNERFFAGQMFLTIVNKFSNIVNIHKNSTITKEFEFVFSEITFKSEKINYNENASIYFPGTSVYMPLFALEIPNSHKNYSTATVVRLFKLRQYMTPLKNTKTCSWVIIVNFGTCFFKSCNFKAPYKLIINNYLGVNMTGTQCAMWEPYSSDGTSIWYNQGCTITSTSDPVSCECDHLNGYGFGFFDNSVNLGYDPYTTTTLLPPTVVDPDEIADEINDILGNITVQNVSSTDHLIESLTNLTDLISDLTANDETIANVSRLLALNITNSSLDCFNRLIETPDKLWTNISIDEVKSISTSILKSVSNLAILMNFNQSTNLTVLSFSSIEMHSQAFPVQEQVDITFNFNGSTKVKLPVMAVPSSTVYNSLQLNKNYRTVAVSAALLGNLSQRLSSSNMLPNSAILSLTVANNREWVNLQDGSLTFEIKHSSNLIFGDRSLCSFWVLSTNSWAQNGCKLDKKRSNRIRSTCECDHLTNFAALADVSNREDKNLAKSILSYALSTSTCFFLGATLYLLQKHNRSRYTFYDDQFKVKTNRYRLNVSITVWLLISNLIILGGMDRVDCAWEIVCVIISLALLYSLLTAFAFSLMLSFHLYLTTSRRHLFRYFSFRTFAFAAYFGSLLVIAFSLTYIYFFEMHNNFVKMMPTLKGDHFCWISSFKYENRIWIFVGPMTVLVLTNCCLLAAVLFRYKRIKRQQFEVQRELLQNYQSESQLINWYLVVILLINFGLPWLSYVFYINEQMSTYFSYVFIVVNGTQGISIFGEQYYIYWKNQQKLKRQLFNSLSTSMSSVDQ